MWWPYWYFHFPNYAFAVLFWTLIGRFMFAIFLPPDSPNYIYRWFRRLTDWVMRPVAYITPSIVPPLALAPIAAYWVAMARIAFFMALFHNHQGVAVIMISSEMPELLGICDRICVMNEGAFVGEFDRAEATQEKIMRVIVRKGERLVDRNLERKLEEKLLGEAHP